MNPPGGCGGGGGGGGAVGGGGNVGGPYSASAADPMGNFVIVWQSAGADGNGFGIAGQRYSSDGAPSGGEFRANESTTGDQTRPTVSVAPNPSPVTVTVSPF